MTEDIPESPSLPPLVLVSEDAKKQGWTVDEQALSLGMAQDYGLSADQIAHTTIVVSGKNRMSYRGSETPKVLDRLLRGSSQTNEGEGSVVRLSTLIQGRARTPEEVNTTLAHELEHVAQGFRGDKRRLAGNALIWGLALAGALAGNYLGRSSLPKRLGGLLIGGAIGHGVGYRLAPHEVRARRKAEEVVLSVVKRHATGDV